MAGGTGAIGSYPAMEALVKTDPTHLADAMVASTAQTLAFGDALSVHASGHEATFVAFEDVIVGAVAVARQIHQREAGAPPDEADLELRARVAVAGHLAMRIETLQPTVPPIWSAMLDELVAREDPGEPLGTAGPLGQRVAAHIRTNITWYPLRRAAPAASD